jgi:acyl transferase domain-containing protein/non-ribosomal peptide synthetase component F
MTSKGPFSAWSSAKLALAADSLRDHAALVAREPIAIIGFDCRFPGGEDPDAFWAMLAAGTCAAGPVPPDRWNADELFCADHTVPGSVATRHGSFLKDVSFFDAAMFRITGREAAVMDPQQRLLLETTWRALEHGAIAPDRLAGSRTGIFVGLNAADYAARILRTGDNTLLDGHVGSGNSFAFAAGRLAYVLGTTGPAGTVDATCSSGLLALHQACQSLRAGECELAIAGGVHLTLSPQEPIYLSRTGALAPDGRSKPFAAEANGFGIGEGCAVFVLARLSSALREGHAIAALLRGSAVSHDGASGGLTVPSGGAQQQVIRLALEAAALEPGDIDFVEAHGTGTPLGDPIELQALAAVFNGSRAGRGKLPVGSVKANVGHTEAAAGLCGVAKVLLALRHEMIPPQPPIASATPHVNWNEIDLDLVGAARRWPRNEIPRRAGVSAFGLSGTNVHVIVEEAPRVPPGEAEAERPSHLYAISAPDRQRLRSLAAMAGEAIRRFDRTSVADICHSANVGRAGHADRAAVRAEDIPSLLEGLTALASGTASRRTFGKGEDRAKAGVVFMVGGQGAAFAGMSSELYRASPVFRHSIDSCAAMLTPALDIPLATILYDPERSPVLLGQTRYAQPALAAVNWSIAMLWQAWGIRPAAIIGHSLGEYVAAALGGMIDVEAMLQLVARRGALMQCVAGGGMVAVAAATEELHQILARHPDISLAAANAERSTVLSGPAAALEALRRELEQRRMDPRPLAVDAAFHSVMMDPVLVEVEALAAKAGFAAPRMPVVSNVTGALHAADAPPPPSYWARHAREPVRFKEGLASLWARGHRLFVEVGPRPMLSLLAAADYGDTGRFVASLAERREWQALLDCAGVLWTEGADLDWEAFDAGYPRRRIAQPPGPLLRKPYWFAEASSAPPQAAPVSEPAAPPVSRVDEVPMNDGESVARIRGELRELLATALGEPPESIRDGCAFAEMGADSIMLADAARMLAARYGVKISLKDLLGDHGNIDGLARAIVRQRGPAPAPMSAQVDVRAPAAPRAAATNAAAAPADVAELMRRQLDLVQRVVSEQLAAIGRLDGGRSEVHRSKPADIAVPLTSTAAEAAAPETRAAPVPVEDEPRRAAHRAALIAAYNKRTARSKLLAEQRRQRFADVRASAGFRASIKEMIYPITGERAEGARVWDVDGNEYIDVSMDFGANLFGHGAPLIREAMQAQLARGLALGPRSPLAGEVAELMCELTGMDRVLFCQSGTESVMTALRLARLARGRSTVAVFRNSYHGHFDGVLGERAPAGSAAAATPIARGILESFVTDLLPLDYGSEAALETIRGRADEIAAVLVEPVQSRALHLQPCEFLHALRELTSRHGILLIFDEMITGFRVHPGGAQAHFGVAADIATYGKMLGGGVPMAAVAVRGDLLKGIDGGIWRFGDRSQPDPETTFFAGTFNNHPLGLAAAKAILTELKERGPELQARLNAQTATLVDGLNQRLGEAEVPLSLIRFGSVFRFAHKGNLDLLYFHLLHRGVFVWEGRNCFLSTAHGESEVAAIADRVLASVDALQEGGFLGGSRIRAASAVAAAPEPSTPIPLSETQRQIWVASQQSGAGALAYVETQIVELTGLLDEAALQRAVADLVSRHEALRTTISAGCQRIAARVDVPLHRDELAEGAAAQRANWIAAFALAPLDLSINPPVRFALLRETGRRHVLVVVAHHVLVDGWSLKLLMQELGALYAYHALGAAPLQKPPAQLRDHLARLERLSADADLEARQRWWRAKLADPPSPLPLAPGGPAPDSSGRPGGRLRLAVTARARSSLEELARRHGTTLFSTALAGTLAYLHRLFERADLLIGIGGSGRAPEEAGLVAQAAQLLPVRSKLAAEATFDEFLRSVATEVAALAERHTEIELAPMLAPLLSARGRRDGPLNVTFNLDRVDPPPPAAGLAAQLLEGPVLGAKFDLCINLTVGKDDWQIDFDFDADAFSASSIRRLAERWMSWVEGLAGQAGVAVADRTVLDAVDDRIVADGNAVNRSFADRDSIAGLIAAQAARRPDDVALSSAGSSLTYGALDATARRVAGKLRDVAKVNPGDVVACMFDTSTEFIVAALGTLYAGAACLPLEAGEAPERVRAIVGQTKPACALCDAAHVASFSAAGIPVIAAPDAAASALQQLPAVPDNAPAWIAIGDGRAKPVNFREAALRNVVCWMRERFPLDAADVVWQGGSRTSEALLWQMLWPLSLGARLAIDGKEPVMSGEELARLVGPRRVTVLPLTPSQLALFLPHVREETGVALRYLLCGGEPLSAPLRDRFFAAGLEAELHILTQLPEFGGALLHWPCLRGGTGRVPSGHPIANVQATLRDRQQRPVPIDVAGELWVDAAFIAGDPVRTGLVSRRRPDGALDCLSASDPSLVEELLLQHPSVRCAAVDTRRFAEGGERLLAWVIPEPDTHGDGAPLDWAEQVQMLRTHLRQSLPAAAVPEQFYAIEKLPLDRQGRLDRAALWAGEAATVVVARAPEGPIEQALLVHWRDELCLEVTGVQDDFVNAGGQSLAAARLAAWIQERWQVSIGLQRILAGPTISELAQMIEQARSAGPLQQIQPRRRRGSRPSASETTRSKAGS